LRFLLIDRIDELARGKSAVGVKNVTMSEDFLTLHFPDSPIMPGALIVEALVQLADWVVREATDFASVGLPLGFERARFHRIVRPGDQLRLAVEALEFGASTARFQGEASCAGRRVATSRFTLGLRAAEPLLAPEEARRLYATLTAKAAE
jgi:3-hydroxyacyl-[acyl-carrier-protein] dehydratase